MNNIRPNALALIYKNGKIFCSSRVDKITNELFYRSLGGGIDFGEDSKNALIREFKEEFNAELTNIEFLTVIENIFEYNGSKGHEITFLYKADFADESLYQKEKMEILDKEGTFAEWVSVEDIKSGKYPLYPVESIKFL